MCTLIGDRGSGDVIVKYYHRAKMHQLANVYAVYISVLMLVLNQKCSVTSEFFFSCLF